MEAYLQPYLREITGASALAVLQLLILLKSDQQFIHVLEGKLHRNNFCTKLAAIEYNKRKRAALTLLALFGSALLGLSVVWYIEGRFASWPAALVGVALTLSGVANRFAAFLDAAKALPTRTS